MEKQGERVKSLALTLTLTFRFEEQRAARKGKALEEKIVHARK